MASPPPVKVSKERTTVSATTHQFPNPTSPKTEETDKQLFCVHLPLRATMEPKNSFSEEGNTTTLDETAATQNPHTHKTLCVLLQGYLRRIPQRPGQMGTVCVWA